MRALIMGPQGSGKGTQALLLSKKYGIVHISTGDIFRYNIEKNTELGIKAQKYIDVGQLVPDELVIELMKDRIIKDDCNVGYILDGFPRDFRQATEFDKFLYEKGLPLDVVINIEINNEELIKRISGRRICANCKTMYNISIENIDKCNVCGGELIQREDDKSDNAINKRLNIYHNQTAPLIGYYKEQGILITVDGLGSVNEVNNKINEALGSMWYEYYN